MDIFLEFLSSEISVIHLSILFLLSIVLLGGTIGGQVFRKIKIPQVVGYIIVGLIIGQMGFKILDEHILEVLQPFNYFALGLIGFRIGGELKKDIFVKHGKQFLYILLSEGLAAFFLVFVLVAIVSYLFLKDIYLSISFGLLLGAIASATAPAATTDVLWEYKARGPLTSIVLGIVALDDALALILFTIAASISSVLLGSSDHGIAHNVLKPFYEIFGSLILGSICGAVLSSVLKKHSSEDRVLAFVLGAVLFVLGLSLTINLDVLLASMTLGVFLVNKTPQRSKEIFRILENFTPPIYVLFFVLFGAKLNFQHLNLFIVVIVVIYLLGRTFGKAIGTKLGAKLSHAPKNIEKYLPYCLFSQAGIAIGLSVFVSHSFKGDIGDYIVLVITTTTFVVQIIGPYFVKYAIVNAGEAGKNITEQDVLSMTKVEDMMQKDVPLIYDSMGLDKILKIFSKTNNLYYPVVNKEKNLIGIITVDTIKEVFMTQGLDHFLLGHDLMEKVNMTSTAETSMLEVSKILSNYGLEYLPIVTNDNRLEGFLETRTMKRLISKKLIEMQKNAE